MYQCRALDSSCCPGRSANSSSAYSSLAEHARPNIVRDTLREQGMTSIGDRSIQALRRIDTRMVSIQNSSPTNRIGFAFTAYLLGPTPKIVRVLEPGESMELSINPHGSHTTQAIWMLDPVTGESAGVPTTLPSNANTFVLRDGVSKWFVHMFYFPSFSAAK